MRTLRSLASTPTAAVALAILTVVALTAAAGPAIAPHDPIAQDTSNVLAPPTVAHWLGTDYLGRDILSRLISGTQLSVFAAIEAVVVELLLGAGSALVSAFSPKPVRWIIERVFDSFMALPFITFAVAIGALLGNSIHAAMVAVGILAAPTFFRVVRASVLETSHAQFVEAARLLGVPTIRIIATHVIPRIVPVVLVTSASVLAASLLVVASLMFLGVGVQPPTPTWGGMLSADLSYLALRPWNPVAPALAIMITVAAVGLLADRIRDLSAVTEEREATAEPGPADEAAVGSATAAATPERSPSVPVDSDASEALVAIDDLRIAPETGSPLVRGVSLRIPRGSSVGVLGESGSGKTMTVRALLGVLPGGVSVTGGTIGFDGEDLTSVESSRRDIHGRRIGTVFQDPATWFTPHLTVGAQVDEALRHTHGLSKRSAASARAELLGHVGLHDVERVAGQYPHELSGGMLQRILLAIAVTGDPDLLIADEATTALDVTVQAEVLELIRRLRRERSLTVLMISHDLAVLAHSCEYLYVFRSGEVVEQGPTEQVLRAPQHPYTQTLIADHTVFGIEAVRNSSALMDDPTSPKETIPV